MDIVTACVHSATGRPALVWNRVETVADTATLYAAETDRLERDGYEPPFVCFSAADYPAAMPHLIRAAQACDPEE